MWKNLYKLLINSVFHLIIEVNFKHFLLKLIETIYSFNNINSFNPINATREIFHRQNSKAAAKPESYFTGASKKIAKLKNKRFAFAS